MMVLSLGGVASAANDLCGYAYSTIKWIYLALMKIINEFILF